MISTRIKRSLLNQDEKSLKLSNESVTSQILCLLHDSVFFHLSFNLNLCSLNNEQWVFLKLFLKSRTEKQSHFQMFSRCLLPWHFSSDWSLLYQLHNMSFIIQAVPPSDDDDWVSDHFCYSFFCRFLSCLTWQTGLWLVLWPAGSRPFMPSYSALWSRLTVWENPLQVGGPLRLWWPPPAPPSPALETTWMDPSLLRRR